MSKGCSHGSLHAQICFRFTGYASALIKCVGRVLRSNPPILIMSGCKPDLPNIVTRSLKNVFKAILLCGLCLGVRGASAEGIVAQAITPFLYPPYPGTASQESIFDHSTPNYTYDNRVLAFTGEQALKFCPSPA